MSPSQFVAGSVKTLVVGKRKSEREQCEGRQTGTAGGRHGDHEFCLDILNLRFTPEGDEMY